MSNGLNNKITMRGTNLQINQLKEFVKNVDDEENEFVFDFRKIIFPPIEPIIQFTSVEITEKGDNSWMLENWGCKCNTWFPRYGDEANQILFDTVNGTGLKIVVELSKIFPEILFEYEFELYMEAYSCEIRNGEILTGDFYIDEDDGDVSGFNGIRLVP